MLSQSLFALLAILAVNAQTISTPAAVIQCQPAQFQVSGGQSPYIVDVIPAGQVSAPAVAFIGDDIAGPTFTWTPDLTSGSNITFRITDSAGSVQYSSPVVIQAGSSDSCLNATASTVPTGGAGTTSGGSSSTSSSLASSSAAGSSTSMAMSSSSASGGNAASSISSRVSSAASNAASGASAASSSVASATQSPNGAYQTGIAGAGALAAGIIGGVAMLF